VRLLEDKKGGLGLGFDLGLDKKVFDIFKTLILGNTNRLITYICNFKMLIFTFISMIYCEVNVCMERGQATGYWFSVSPMHLVTH